MHFYLNFTSKKKNIAKKFVAFHFIYLQIIKVMLKRNIRQLTNCIRNC